MKISNRTLTSISWNKNCFDSLMFLVGIGESSELALSLGQNYKSKIDSKSNYISSGIGTLQGNKDQQQSNQQGQKIKESTKGHLEDILEAKDEGEEDNCLALWGKDKDGNWKESGKFKYGNNFHQQGVLDVS